MTIRLGGLLLIAIGSISTRTLAATDVCPASVPTGTVSVLLVTGAGFADLEAAQIDASEVLFAVLHDSLLYVLTPALPAGPHELQMVDRFGARASVFFDARETGFQEAVDTVSCVRSVLVQGSTIGLIEAATAASLDHRFESVEDSLRRANANSALGQVAAAISEILREEGDTVDTGYGEGLIGLLNASLLPFLFDTSPRPKSIRAIVEQQLLGVPQNAPERLGTRDCSKLGPELAAVVAGPGRRVRTAKFVRKLGGTNFDVHMFEGDDGLAGQEAPAIEINMPGLNNAVVVAVSGDGGNAAAGALGAPGPVGGNGGLVDITVGDDDLVIAVSGRGGRGGTGGAGAGAGGNGGKGGVGGTGGDVFVKMGFNSIVCIHSGEGGRGGNGGAPAAGGLAGTGGKGGRGGDITMTIASLEAPAALSSAKAGNGGSGGDENGDGGRGGNVTRQGGIGGAAAQVPLTGEGMDGAGRGGVGDAPDGLDGADGLKLTL